MVTIGILKQMIFYSKNTFVKGFKTALKNNDHEYLETADRIIRNTYRTLMSRGLKGCYVYATNPHLIEYLRKGVSQDE
jgi:uncharacterized protein